MDAPLWWRQLWLWLKVHTQGPAGSMAARKAPMPGVSSRRGPAVDHGARSGAAAGAPAEAGPAEAAQPGEGEAGAAERNLPGWQEGMRLWSRPSQDWEELNLDEVLFRPMYVSDLGQVMQVEHLSFPTPWSKNAFYGELLDNPRARYLVAVWRGRVIGYIGMWLLFDEAHITNVAVHPRYRGHHLGRRLMERGEELARQHGIRRMTLEVRKSNAAARHLYESLGYRAVGVRPGYYRDNNEDAIIMWKNPPPEMVPCAE